jgi:DHA1 family bicyclomycin/chloramphenicol resistance-like MFS transporter
MCTGVAVGERQVGCVGSGVGGRVRLVLLLGGLIALGPLSIDLYLPALPRIAHDLRAGEADVQLTLTGMLAGLAVGQVLVGPLSDAVGRRRPLIVGSGLHAAASLACALAPTVELLDAARVLQGLGASAGAVLGMAVVRDLFAGRDSARVLSRMMLVMRVSPILAPSLGTALLGVVEWRWLFGVLAGLGLLIMVFTALALPETLPAGNRVPLRLRAIAGVHARLLGDRRFVRLTLAAGLMVAGPFGFVAGAPFVLQQQFGVDQSGFGLLFGVSIGWLFAASQVNSWLLRRYRPTQLLVAGGVGAAVAGPVMVSVALSGLGGLPGMLAAVWAMLFFCGLLMPNASAVVLDAPGEAAAGTAAGVLGAARWGVSAVVSPLVGMLGNTALAMSVVCACGLVAATVLFLPSIRPNEVVR